jgi:hypothetical protein
MSSTYLVSILSPAATEILPASAKRGCVNREKIEVKTIEIAIENVVKEVNLWD